MSHRANPTLIGAFVVGALALAVAGALILGGRHWFARPQPYVMFFDGSVAGLAVGSPVQYRGVPLGSVTDIRAVAGANQIAVFIALDVEKFWPDLGPGPHPEAVRDLDELHQELVADPAVLTGPGPASRVRPSKMRPEMVLRRQGPG
jgi:paraquat-inducible protein B